MKNKNNSDYKTYQMKMMQGITCSLRKVKFITIRHAIRSFHCANLDTVAVYPIISIILPLQLTGDISKTLVSLDQ